LALHRAPQRLRQRLSGGLAQQVVPKPQLLIVFDERIRAHRLLDRRHQRRRLAVQHRGQQTRREPVRQHGGLREPGWCSRRLPAALLWIRTLKLLGQQFLPAYSLSFVSTAVHIFLGFDKTRVSPNGS
jgi:hypothetical protein